MDNQPEEQPQQHFDGATAKYRCPHCNAEYDENVAQPGDRVECTNCKQGFTFTRSTEGKDPVEIICTHCKKSNIISKSRSGQKVICQHYRQPFRVPMGTIDKISCGCLVIIILAVAAGIFFGVKSCNNRAPETVEEEAVVVKPQTLSKFEAAKKAHRNAWNGSNVHLVKYIKSLMNDPDSFKHEGSWWIESTNPDADFYTVKMIFFGKNAFNATIKQTVIAKIGFDGTIIEVKEANP